MLSLALTPTKSGRTCIGCGGTIHGVAPDPRSRSVGPAVEHDGSGSVRLVRGSDGAIAVDAKGGAFGRGAHVHTRPDCIAKAAERGLARSFKAKCEATAASLAREIAAALDRRIEGLLVSAARTRSFALGAAETSALLLVAVDGSGAFELDAVRAAIAAGKAVSWGTTREHQRLVSPDAKSGVISITSEKIAEALGEAVRARDASLSASEIKTNSRRARGETAREAVSPCSTTAGTNQAERGA